MFLITGQRFVVLVERKGSSYLNSGGLSVADAVCSSPGSW